MDHLGSLQSKAYSCVTDESEDDSILSNLLPVVYKSSSSTSHSAHTFPRSHDHPEPMIAVAMEMKLDKERSSKVIIQMWKKNQAVKKIMVTLVNSN